MVRRISALEVSPMFSVMGFESSDANEGVSVSRQRNALKKPYYGGGGGGGDGEDETSVQKTESFRKDSLGVDQASRLDFASGKFRRRNEPRQTS